MNENEIFSYLRNVLAFKRLTTLEEFILLSCWRNKSYEQIALESSYEASYVKNVASKLWRRITEAVGERVTRTNVCSVLGYHMSLAQSIQSGPFLYPSVEKTVWEPSFKVAGTWEHFPVTTSCFFGRENERALLQAWILGEKACSMVVLTGISGIGKTALAKKLLEWLAPHFPRTAWNFLKDAPSALELIQNLIASLSGHEEVLLPGSLQAGLDRLLEYLKRERCLLVLDNLEAVLEHGYYRSGYEEYRELFERVATEVHTSVVVVTSREIPREIERLNRCSRSIRILPLEGLAPSAAQAILVAEGLPEADPQAEQLAEWYHGNPLMLKIAARSVMTVFAGRIGEFLKHRTGLVGSIRTLLDEQFKTLDSMEHSLMLWLAIEREPCTVARLQENLYPRQKTADVIQGLESLLGKALVECTPAGITLQPVIMEYATERLIDAAAREILEREDDGSATLSHHALLLATAKDHLRATQKRLLIDPFIALCVEQLGTRQALKARLEDRFARLKPTGALERGYWVANFIHLLTHMEYGVDGYDFSDCAIWQACLQEIPLPGSNLHHADLRGSSFQESFGDILSIASSPEGTLTAFSTTTGEIFIRSQEHAVAICRGHTFWVWAISFSPEGGRILSGSMDKTVRLWNAETGACLRVFQQEGLITAAAFAPDGTLFACGGGEQIVYLWSLQGEEPIRAFQGHTGVILSVAFSPDGELLASSGEDRTIRLWEVASGHLLRTLEGHTDQVCSLHFDASGSVLASASYDGTVVLWEVKTGEKLHHLHGHAGKVFDAVFAPDGRTIASGGDDGIIRLWNVRTGKVAGSLRGHTARIFSLSTVSDRNAPGGWTLVSGGADRTVRYWDTGVSECIQTLQGYSNGIYGFAVAPDGCRLAGGCEDGSIRFWDFPSGQHLGKIQAHRGLVWSVSYDTQGASIASAGSDGSECLYETVSGRLLFQSQSNLPHCRPVLFSPDGKWLLTVGEKETLIVRDALTHQALHTLQTGCADVSSFALLSGKTEVEADLLVGSYGGHLNLLNWNSPTPVSLRRTADPVFAVAVHPIEPWVAAACGDGSVELWHLQSKQLITRLCGHQNAVAAVAFNREGYLLASASLDKSIRLWDLKSRTLTRILVGHTREVLFLVFGSDGDTLISSSPDGSIRIWSASQGQCAKVIETPRPYAGMNITAIQGVSPALKKSLKILGAVDFNPEDVKLSRSVTRTTGLQNRT